MITNKKIDNGSSFDFGMISQDYARYRDIYPKSFYNRIYELGFIVNLRSYWILEQAPAFFPEKCINTATDFNSKKYSV